jgi:hypothetical protein
MKAARPETLFCISDGFHITVRRLYPQHLAYLPHRFLYLGIALQVVHVQRIARLTVEWLTLRQRSFYVFQHFRLRLAFEQGTFRLPHTQMAVKNLRGGLQIDGAGLFVHILHIVEETRRAAACRQHDILKLSHLMQHVTLHLK